MSTTMETPARPGGRLKLDADGVPSAPTSNSQVRPFAPIRQSLILAGRALTKIRRTPEQLIDVTLQPILFTIIFVYLFGGAISGSTHTYLQYVLPGLMVQTLLFSTLSIGVNMSTDIEKGIFDRFRSLPITRSAPLVGAVLGDIVRYVVSIVVLLTFGYIIGFRIGTNPLLALCGCLLGLGFALAISWVFVWLGMIVRTSGSVQGIGFLTMFPLTFGSSLLVKADTMPGWLQSWVKINPVSHLTEAIRNLMMGGPTAGPVIYSVLWAAGIMAVFAPLAVRAYRRRA